MLESATSILSHYIDTPHWYKFRFFKQIYIDVEERGYICQIDNRWLFIYETDFLILDLPKVLNEISDHLNERQLAPVHWLAKEDIQQNFAALSLDTSVENNKTAYDSLIFKNPSNSFVYAVLEVKRI